MNNSFAGQVAVVTGANRGIGFEICRQLSGLGIRVILTSRDEAKGVRAQKQLAEEGLAASLDSSQIEWTCISCTKEQVDLSTGSCIILLAD